MLILKSKVTCHTWKNKHVYWYSLAFLLWYFTSLLFENNLSEQFYYCYHRCYHFTFGWYTRQCIAGNSFTLQHGLERSQLVFFFVIGFVLITISGCVRLRNQHDPHSHLMHWRQEVYKVLIYSNFNTKSILQVNIVSHFLKFWKCSQNDDLHFQTPLGSTTSSPSSTLLLWSSSPSPDSSRLIPPIGQSRKKICQRMLSKDKFFNALRKLFPQLIDVTMQCNT